MAENHGCTEQQLERMMDEYGTTMLRLCCVYLKNESAAEDAVQETFIKVYQKCPEFESCEQEKAWVMRVAVNVCKDMLRSGWYKHVLLTEEYAEPVERTSSSEDNYELLKAVQALKPNYRVVILLHFYLDFRVNEIAQMLKTPQSTISVRIMRAKKILKSSLTNEKGA